MFDDYVKLCQQNYDRNYVALVLNYCRSTTTSIFSKFTDFDGLRCHRNVTIMFIKSIFIFPDLPTSPSDNIYHLSFSIIMRN